MIPQLDLPVTAFDRFDVDQTTLDFLLWKIGARQHVTPFLIELTDTFACVVQFGKVQHAAYWIIEQSQKSLRVEQQVAVDLEAY